MNMKIEKDLPVNQALGKTPSRKDVQAPGKDEKETNAEQKAPPAEDTVEVSKASGSGTSTRITDDRAKAFLTEVVRAVEEKPASLLNSAHDPLDGKKVETLLSEKL